MLLISGTKYSLSVSPETGATLFRIMSRSSAPELYTNSSNPYTELSDEERAKEFDSIFGLLLAESYRETGKAIYGNKKGCK